ncbi:hypothetical protein [Aquimarina macrocephali]|uniref:hypothetical protein n=1 Tax=Aquimarina macrocephali TaxID=666563 RepID=UPI003F664FD0
MINENIISFLINRDWQVFNENSSFIELSPPEEFQLKDEFKLHVPKNLDKVDTNNFIDNILDIVGEFYSLSVDDLNILLKQENTVFKVRVYDKQTEEGKIPLGRFEELVDRIRSILSGTASFVIDKSVISTKTPEEVSRYLNLCNFMQTEKGSFVAKIQLPSKELIKENELFERNEIYSQEINNKLSEVLTYINHNIFEGDIKVSEEYLIENESRINIKLFKDIESLFEKAKIKNVDFTFHNIESSNTVINKNITKQKLYKLNQFVEQIESHSYEIDVFTLTGQIVALKSKNPDGLKNSVSYVGIFDNMQITVAANLDSEQYKQAIEAHKMKLNISITGLAKKTKSRARFLEITDFTIED